MLNLNGLPALLSLDQLPSLLGFRGMLSLALRRLRRLLSVRRLRSFKPATAPARASMGTSFRPVVCCPMTLTTRQRGCVRGCGQRLRTMRR